MLFNSVPFLFYFLPIIFVGYLLISHFWDHKTQIIWLILASLFFYAFWNPPFIALLLGSILLNYLFGGWLSVSPQKKILALGIASNLALIGIFKYTGFLAETANYLSGLSLPVPEIALPLAISFFTFQQIAYLVDVYQGKVTDQNFLRYILFVSFFPQLIAGPIVHHSEVIPQFSKPRQSRDRTADILAGLAIFIIGLQKKIVLADGIGVYASAVFDGAADTPPTFLIAWIGTLAYSFQIYFDFSGYSDMAIGLARMFGIRLPENFASPYKATNIVEFWRRWHMTLSRFLRDYLYVPLGGNRRGKNRRYMNIMITMLLGGLWHGAAWTFVFWGALHGLFILLHHLKQNLFQSATAKVRRSGRLARGASISITFVLVSVTWVFFRADTWEDAIAMIYGLAGLNGFAVSHSIAAALQSFTGVELASDFVSASQIQIQPMAILWLIAVGGVVFVMPNTNQIVERLWKRPSVDTGLQLNFFAPAMLVCAVVSVFIVISKGTETNDFIYMVF